MKGFLVSNVPMTRPEEMLVVHHTNYAHSVTWVKLDSGRIVLGVWSEFTTSDDGGLTWSQPYKGKHADGEPISRMLSLVSLDSQTIGMAFQAESKAGDPPMLSQRMFFCKSTDQCRNWSKPILINDGQPAMTLTDRLMRTSSGRLICPVHTALGHTPRNPCHIQGAPVVGGYLNGNFVSCDAHFYDPHFGAAFVYYSDDNGQTWQRNEDGELFILLDYGANSHAVWEPTVCEVQAGKLLMMVRCRLGRLFQAWSYDNGQTWTPLQPTQLAASPAPAYISTLPNGHLLCVFTQQSPEEIRKGFIRTRLSAAISRNGGGIWEHFQNVESIHEQTHVEPGPLEVVRPAGGYSMPEAGAFVNNPKYVVPLPVGYGRWSYPSVLILDDRVLISHTYSYHDQTGNRADIGYNNKIKVLPLSWFYGSMDPNTANQVLTKLADAPRP